MKKLFISITLMMLSSLVFAQRFDVEYRAFLDSMSVKIEVDKRSLPTYIKEIESRINAYDSLEVNDETNAQKAILHALCGYLYDNAKLESYINRDDSYTKAEEHWNQMLSQKASLARQKAEDYKSLIETNEGSEIFDHDLLHSLVEYLLAYSKSYFPNYSKRIENQIKIYKECAETYKSMGRETAYKYLMQKCEYLEMKEKCPYERTDRIVYLREFLKTHPDTYFIPEIEQMQNDALLPFVEFDTHNIDYANQPILCKAYYWNANEASLNVYKYVGDDKVHMKGMNRDTLNSGNYMLAYQHKFHFGDDEINHKRLEDGLPLCGSDSIEFSLSAGEYVFEYISCDNIGYTFQNVKSMAVIGYQYSKDKYCCMVVDPKSGKPLPGEKVEYETSWYLDHSDEKGEEGEKKTNAEGEIYFKINGDWWNLYLTAYRTKTDYTDFDIDVDIDDDIDDKREFATSKSCYMFTDRSVYRPGQTIKVSGIIAKGSLRDDYKVVKGHRSKIGLYDLSSDTVIFEKEIVSNEYGSFDVEFHLDEFAKVGEYSIKTMCKDCKDINDGCHIRIEEYKRPTWEMKLGLDSTRSPLIGDTVYVHVKANTYVGTPVCNARLSYVVKSTEDEFGDYITILYNSQISDETGKFTIPIVLSSDSKKKRYSVQVVITDEAGETHERTEEFVIEQTDFNITKIDQTIDLSKEDFIQVNAVNSFDIPVSVDLSYELSLRGKVVGAGVFNTCNKVKLSNLYEGNLEEMAMGDYRLALKAYDRVGNLVSETITINVFDSNPLTASRRAIEFTDDFFYIPSRIFINDKLDVYFIPKSDSCYVVQVVTAEYPVSINKNVYDRKLNHIVLNYDRKMRDRTRYNFFYFHDYKLIDHECVIGVPQKDKKLNVSLKTFRDKVTPGNKERWVVTVNDLKSKSRKGVEMLASMYDASLDAIKVNEWYFNIYASQWPLYCRVEISDEDRNMYKIIGGKLVKDKVNTRLYDTFNLFKNAKVKNVSKEISVACQSQSFTTLRGISFIDNRQVLHEYCVNVPADLLKVSPCEPFEFKSTSSNNDFLSAKTIARNNFEETAFFYPHLVADTNSDVNIEFTMPESLTKWKFQCLAHDKNMNYGLNKATVIASKSFMVQPLMPRFIRVGDNATIATRIINQSDKALTGKTVMRLLHAKDESLISAQSVDFSVEAGKTTSVSFSLTAASSDDDIICEIVAEANDGVNVQVSERSNGKVSQLSTLNSQLFSDGERNLIPVLPSRMVITESVPFYIKGGEEKSVDLSALYNGNSETADEKTMSIEYVSTPSWIAIDALRHIESTNCECATCLAASAYASDKLIQMSEQLGDYTRKGIIDVKKEHNNFDEKMSRLENLIDYRGLVKWFPGSRNVSCFVSLLVAEQLSKMSQRKKIVKKSRLLSELDKEALKDYENACINDRPVLTESVYHYLNVCSMNKDRELGKDVQDLHNILLDSIETNIENLTIYGMASSANILRAFGRQQSADKLVDILHHYLVCDEGQGKHFESSRAQYSWRDYRIPTQVAAMNALYAANPYDENLNDMTLWLLRQKQVQTWDNPVNTVDVADLLLKMNTFGHTTPSTSSLPEMWLNGKVLTSQSFVKDNVKDTLYFSEEMGYMNKQVDPSLIGNGNSSLFTLHSSLTTLRSSLPNISWGAVTATFTEDFDHLKSYTTGEVRITRHLMVERDGKWVDMKKDEVLKVGQKVRVRHTLKTDRDMDFVRIKSLHPACFEPVDKLSGYCWKGGNGYYQSIHDNNIEIFYERLREGTSTIDTEYFVTRPGTYNMGITTAECTYAPSFGGHSEGMKVVVE